MDINAHKPEPLLQSKELDVMASAEPRALEPQWTSHWDLHFDDKDREQAFIGEHVRSSMPVIRESLIPAIVTWGICHFVVGVFATPRLLLGTAALSILYLLFGLGFVIADRPRTRENGVLLQRMSMVTHVYSYAVILFVVLLYIRNEVLGIAGIVTVIANSASTFRHRTSHVLGLMLMGATLFLVAHTYLALTGAVSASALWAAPALVIAEGIFGVFTARASERALRESFLKDLLIRKQQEQIRQEKARSESLRLNNLPEPIAMRLRDDPGIIAEEQQEASVLFADLTGFTSMSSGMTAGRVVEMLNEVFSKFDLLIERHGLEKIKTIGDCYMAASGVPRSRHDHAEVLVTLALEMRDLVDSRDFFGKRLQFRFGVNSGPVVAGVIGRKKFIYDLWGDTVNVASRMESNGHAGTVQISEEARRRLPNSFVCEPRGRVHMKGKGEMDVFHVIGAATA